MPSSSSPSACESEPPSHSLWPDVSLLGVALIWGVNMPFMKIGLEQLDPFAFNALRLVISAVCLAWVALRDFRRGIRPRSGLRISQIVTYAVVVSGMYQVLFLLGIARTTAGNTGLIMATVPAWTTLLAWMFLRERLVPVAWGGLLLALCGTVVVAIQSGNVSGSAEHLTGNLLVLGAAIAWAAGTVYSRPLLKSISPMQLSACSAVLALPLHLWLGAGRLADSLPALQSASLWLILLYAGVLSSGLTLPMWSYGVRHAGAAHASAIQNLVPVIAIAAAWLVRSETPSGLQLLGGAIILTGLVTMRVGRRIEQSRLTAVTDTPAPATDG